MENKEYERLLKLKDLIGSGEANSVEKTEYVELMYLNGHITEKQYQDYKAGKNSDEIIKAVLTIGAVVLAGWLLGKLLEK